MTNNPEFEWHLKNLSNYLSIQPTNPNSKKFGDFQVKPFGQGSGTLGLPGKFTSPERFIRAVYLCMFADTGKTVDDALTTIFRILCNVAITKGNQYQR